MGSFKSSLESKAPGQEHSRSCALWMQHQAGAGGGRGGSCRSLLLVALHTVREAVALNILLFWWLLIDLSRTCLSLANTHQ